MIVKTLAEVIFTNVFFLGVGIVSNGLTEIGVDLGYADKQVATLSESANGLDLSTPDGYKEAVKVIASARKMRTGVEKSRVELNVEPLARCKAINAEAKRVTNLITAIEDPLKAKKFAIDDKANQIKLAKAKAEKDAAEARERAERERVEAEQKAERDRIEAEQKAERERLAADREKLKAEREKIEAEQKADREKLAEERRKLEAEQEKVRVERERVEQEKRDAEKAEADRLQALTDAKAKVETERLAAIEKAAADKQAEADRIEAEKQAEADRIAQLKATEEAEAIREADRLTKSPVVLGMLSGIVGRDVDIGIEGHDGLLDFNGGKLGFYDGVFSVDDGIVFLPWMVDSVEIDCDGSLFLSLNSDGLDRKGAPQRCYDELAELNDWEVGNE